MSQPQKIFLKDYTAPDFAAESIDLSFQIEEDFCRVQSKISIRKLGQVRNLFLDGEDLELESVSLNQLPAKYELQKHGLLILDVPENFILQIANKIKPQTNTSLEGLYCSGKSLISQCEAQGFRRITYFLDRPDVMSLFTVHIDADLSKYPILLSNGDKIAEIKKSNGRHQVTWSDPFKKPCYLFALVAGDFGVLKKAFTTQSGKEISLEIFSQPGTQSLCEHAMESLQKSMKWDQERFGREYDLSTYMIVAADDFNAGAMENKGLNVFNSKLIFADPKTATDDDYYNIESVVAHEYFHNWTGNRVTLRDWFHLSLKEGLTVFRDQEFSMDMSSRSLVRIDNVNDLRTRQFAEDAGPNAHPIRPASCYAVDNFFTSTIYEKGSEVIRMMQTLVGRPGFRKGMDLYFDRHDGQAVIIEDFAKAIADANQQDWSQFRLWYSQAGTPTVTVRENFDSERQQYTLVLEQSCPLSTQEKADGIDKKPFQIPLIVGLLKPTGQEYHLECDKLRFNSEGQALLNLQQSQETFVFKNISEKPVLSLNREFSAPIQLLREASFADLLFQVKFDKDAFNRWESLQKIYLSSLEKLIRSHQDSQKQDSQLQNILQTPAPLVEAFQHTLSNPAIDAALKAKLLRVPSSDLVAQNESTIDSQAIYAARTALKTAFAEAAEKELLSVYRYLHGKNLQSKDPRDFGRRQLKNLCLDYLCYLPKHQPLAWEQLLNAEIMTDEESAFAIVLNFTDLRRQQAIDIFFQKWNQNSLVINKWFALQAGSSHLDTFSTVKKLWEHPNFNRANPNNVYSLIRNFGRNLIAFHRGTGETYEFMATVILELDRINPQVATRVASCFDVWRKLPPELKEKAYQALLKIKSADLSKNTFEVINKNIEASF